MTILYVESILGGRYEVWMLHAHVSYIILAPSNIITNYDRICLEELWKVTVFGVKIWTTDLKNKK